MGKVGSAKTAISTPDQNREIRSLNDKVFDAFADDIDEESEEANKAWQRVQQAESAANGKIAKRSWTKEEDDLLEGLILRYGTKSWKTIAEHMPDRSDQGIRERWYNQLDPNIKKDKWTQQEDAVIIEARDRLNNKWTEIAKLLPGRTGVGVKNRWNSTLRRVIETVGTVNYDENKTNFFAELDLDRMASGGNASAAASLRSSCAAAFSPTLSSSSSDAGTLVRDIDVVAIGGKAQKRARSDKVDEETVSAPPPSPPPSPPPAQAQAFFSSPTSLLDFCDQGWCVTD